MKWQRLADENVYTNSRLMSAVNTVSPKTSKANATEKDTDFINSAEKTAVYKENILQTFLMSFSSRRFINCPSNA